MLPFYAAAAHNNYTQLIQIYLTQTSRLKINHPSVELSFETAAHSIRCSGTFFSGHFFREDDWEIRVT